MCEAICGVDRLPIDVWIDVQVEQTVGSLVDILTD